MTDLKVVKTEMYDVDAMESLLSHDGVNQDSKKLLKAYKRLRVNGNTVQVVYEYGKKVKSARIGRLYPQRGLGLQNFPSDVRACLAQKYYWDVDMVNSQPVLLCQMAEKNGWRCDRLKEYVEKRSDKLKEIMEMLECDRDGAKTMCISVMFGAQYKKAPPFILELQQELIQLTQNIVNAHPEIVKALKGEDAKTIVAHVLQNQEFIILQFIDKKLQEYGREMDVYIHDGGCVRRLADEKEFSSDLLRQLEKDVSAKFGYAIKLEVKPLTHSFEFKKDKMRTELVSEKDYQKRKEQFEQDHFFCLENQTICKKTINGLSQFPLKNLCTVFAPYHFERQNSKGVMKVEKFIDLWCNDPMKETRERLVFRPTHQDISDSEYNLFHGFAGAKYQEPIDEKVRDLVEERFTELIKVNSAYDDTVYQYQLRWFALLIQRPDVIPGVALIWQNTKQGTGKDMTVDFIGKSVIGESFYKNIRNVETELFDPHSTAREGTLLMKLEEADGAKNRRFDSLLKSEITSTWATINPKGLKKYDMDVFPHIVMTTNKAVPVKIEEQDRRYCIVATSDKYHGNSAFWTETLALLNRPEAGRIVYDLLMRQDLDGFNVRDFPKTMYHEHLSQSEVASEVQFIAECEPFTDLKGTALHALYVRWCADNELTPKGAVHFCRSLAPAIATGVVSRRLKDGMARYSKE